MDCEHDGRGVRGRRSEAIVHGCAAAAVCALLALAVFAAVGTDGSEAEGDGDFTFTVSDDGTTHLSRYGGTDADVVIPGEMTDEDGTVRTVTVIDCECFKDNLDVRTVTVPDSVRAIGDSAFMGCSNLSSITLSQDLDTVGVEVFRDCSSLKSIAIPDKVTSIKENTFLDCTGLENVTLPQSLTYIGEDAFRGCNSLKEIALPDSLASVGRGAFLDCHDLASVAISQSSQLADVGDFAFEDCTSLREMVFTDALESVGRNAFDGCSLLEKATFPDKTFSFGDNLFDDCASLKSFRIPENSTFDDDYSIDMPKNPFSGCRSLGELTVDESNEKYYMNGNFLMMRNGGGEADSVLACIGEAKGDVAIPVGVERVEPYAFSGCDDITSISIPKSVTVLYYIDTMFGGCDKLERFVAEDGGDYVNDDQGILYLQSKTSVVGVPPALSGEVNLPATLDHYVYGVFDSAPGVTAINFAEGSPVTKDFVSIDGVVYWKNESGQPSSLYDVPRAKTGSLDIPSTVDMIDTDVNRLSGNRLSDINYSPNESLNVSYASVDGVLFFMERDNASGTNVPKGLFAFPGARTEYAIPDTVTSIENSSFYGSEIQKVTIPASVKSIHWGAFADCTDLREIVFADGVTELPDINSEYRPLPFELGTLDEPVTCNVVSDLPDGCLDDYGNVFTTFTYNGANGGGGDDDESNALIYVAVAAIAVIALIGVFIYVRSRKA